MRLNADILLDKLGKKYTAVYYGPQVTRMHLKRPQIYDVYQGQPSFAKNRTYCLTTDSLPRETDGERCTCKMKVDTHKSVGVYFFPWYSIRERM